MNPVIYPHLRWMPCCWGHCERFKPVGGPFANCSSQMCIRDSIKGTPTDLTQVDERDRYSWLKTPLWRGHQMEVGPLARMLIGYARKNDDIKGLVDDFLGRAGGVPVTVLQSTLGRIAARSLELAWAAEKMRYFYDRLITNLKNGVRATANTTCLLYTSGYAYHALEALY